MTLRSVSMLSEDCVDSNKFSTYIVQKHNSKMSSNLMLRRENMKRTRKFRQVQSLTACQNSAKTTLILSIFLIIFTLSGISTATQTMDVLEKEDVLLECKFPTQITDREIILYWIRSNRNGHDNVAIGNLILENNYSVRHRPVNGTYDLRITNATYDRDNGQFECTLKEGGTGKVLHSKSIDLTVLLKPSKPIITPSSLTTATERKPLNLTCSSVGGSPPPQIKWYSIGNDQMLDATIIRGKNKDEPTKSILSITPTRKDDGSSYRCTVWNRALRQQQNLHTDTKLYVNYFPRVTVGPANPLKVKLDETVRFECIVDAKPSVTSVKWTRKERFIETNFKHTIPKVRLQDSGSYICAADNGLGETGKTELILDVLYPPIVTLQEEKVVHEGENVNVECQIASNPKATSVQWFMEGDDTFHQPGSILRINSVTAKNNGRYVCSASNFIEPTGGARNMHTGNATIAINVHHRPGKAYIIPSRNVAIDGKRISLTCGANPPGYPRPQYKWWKEGSEATLTTGPTFTINPARLSNTGMYHCRASNKFGSSKVADFDLKVHQAPRILTHLPPSAKKSEGDLGYSLSCSAIGKPRPLVTWFKNGKVIDEEKSNVYQISVAERETLKNGASTVTSTLLFSGPERLGTNKIMPTDRGHYTCQYHNEVTSTDSTMLLKIEHAPVFLHKHNKVAFDVGETAYISCKMQAYPEPKFSWSFGNNPIQNDRIVHEKNFTQLRDDIYQGILKINRVTQASYGDYKCKGTNRMGVKRTLIRLQPKGKPERPINLHAIDIAYNYITIAFDKGFDGGYSNTKFIVQYQQQNNPHPEYEDCGPLHICNITSLKQNSMYTLAIKASNQKGESKYSQDIHISTRIDIRRIPLPQNVHYERSTSLASFNVSPTMLKLIAKIELENNDGTWSQYNALPVRETPFSEMIRNNVSVKNLRVRFCLETNEELCGSYTEALVVDKKEPDALKAAFKEPWVIGLIVVIIILALVAMLILIKCCFYKNVKTIKAKDVTSSNGKVVHATQAPPPYTSTYGVENKGVDTLKDASSDKIKANIYASQNGYTTYHSNGQVTYPEPPNSNTNSANGGSVNSQDSLWNVKNNGNSDAFNQQQMQQQQMSTYVQNSGQQSGHLHYDSQTQPMQAHAIANGFAGNEDYTHYPYPDEYLNDRNCQYIVGQNSDPSYLGSISKSQSHHIGIDSEYSPYGDVNGLPNPFHDSSSNHIGDMSLGQQSIHSHGHPAVLHSHHHHHPLQHLQQPQSAAQQHPQKMQKMSFDEQLGETGFTTPSTKGRRVIREIIV